MDNVDLAGGLLVLGVCYFNLNEMNLTQIIEKAEGEFGDMWDLNFSKTHWLGKGKIELKQDAMKIILRSFLSEKIKEAYEAGYQDCEAHNGLDN